MKPKRTVSAYILLVGILGLSVVGGLVIYGIYSSFVTTQVTLEQATLIRPLDGEIDTALLDSMQNRRRFTAAELAAAVTPTPTTAEETQVEASPAAAVFNQ